MRAVKASSFIVMLLLVAASLVQMSCQNSTHPSVLVIAVDDLSVLDILCNEEDMTNANRSGFEVLCRESVRFTHAFNPSVLSVPTLASILTGVYPFQHRVRNNGQPGLDPQFTTVAEVALSKNYRTAFFSGGPPVWRKSGLNQGFELFDDNIIPARQTLYRPFSSSIKSLMQWLRLDVGHSAFFSMIYVPDLIFTNTVTMNEFGEARNLSHESQLDELDSNLFQLFAELKNIRRWNNTTLVVVGLNGHTSDDRPGELTPVNLHSENTQVALFVKPAQKVRDEALQWKIDRNVTLVDLGQSLFELISNEGNPNKPVEVFPVFSLKKLVQKNQIEWPENRLILMESDWPPWRGLGNRRSAVLSNHNLLIYDKEPQFFNTLTDRLETNPLRSSEMPAEERQKILTALDAVEGEPWSGLEKETLRKYTPGFYRWLRFDQKASLLRDLKARSSGKNPDPDTLRWAAFLAFELKDWNSLKSLGQKAEQPLWQFIADRNGATGTVTRFSMFQDPCLRLLEIPKLDSTDLKKCDNALFLDFIDWQRADLRNLSRETQKRRFERSYLNHLVDQNIKQGYLATTLIWDVSTKTLLGPELVDLVLSLPEYQKQKASLLKALQNSNTWGDDED